MAHTFTKLLYHCVFSTKQRRPFLTADVMERLVPFVGGIIRERSGKLLAMNGPADHVHLLAILPARRAVSDVLRDVKAGSSGWIHDTFPDVRDFAWQEGYGAFTVSTSGKRGVMDYIERQQRHHAKMSFMDEFLLLLKKHEVEYDPQYVFD
jgi:putative transposase